MKHPLKSVLTLKKYHFDGKQPLKLSGFAYIRISCYLCDILLINPMISPLNDKNRY